MSWVAVGSAAIKIGGAYVASKVASKAAGSSSTGGENALPYTPLDINKVISDARNTAAENYKNSISLEAQYNPQQAALRNAATSAAITASMNPPGALPYKPSDVSNSLLNESADSILQSLRLGGSLPADVQSEVVRAALSKGGQAGLAGSFAGRGLVAKDIGTTSLALQKERQQQALQAGTILDQLGLNRAQFGLQQNQANNLNAFQFKTLADSYGLPESGLSAGSVAGLYTANNNAANQVGQNQAIINQQNANQRAAQMSQLLGFGASTIANSGVIQKVASKWFGSGSGGGSGVDSSDTLSSWGS